MKISKRILPVIVFSQFAGTSLWFAVNAVIEDLQSAMNVGIEDTGIITSAIQLGFILGTFLFALLSLSDKYSPRKLFLVCSILGAISNLLIYFIAHNLLFLLILRFLTGIFLTGIYPIGMKIASGYYKKGLGNAIGLLVGALVLGTAFPHLIKSLGGSLPWPQVIFSVSALSGVGGILMYIFVPDGPYAYSGTLFNPNAIIKVFKNQKFRSAAFGYFGHMWELYSFWAFVPIILHQYLEMNSTEINISFWSFLIIAAGSIGCILGGFISIRKGSTKVAAIQLLFSGICCIISPLMFHTPLFIFLSYLIFWGITIIGDSPQYSAIIALTVPKELVGSSLTLVNSIGFAITIPSLWVLHNFSAVTHISFSLMILGIGPIVGLTSMYSLLFTKNKIDEIDGF